MQPVRKFSPKNSSNEMNEGFFSGTLINFTKNNTNIFSIYVFQGGTMTPTENSSSKNDLKELVGEENKDFYDVVEMAAKFQPTGNSSSFLTFPE